MTLAAHLAGVAVHAAGLQEVSVAMCILPFNCLRLDDRTALHEGSGGQIVCLQRFLHLAFRQLRPHQAARTSACQRVTQRKYATQKKSGQESFWLNAGGSSTMTVPQSHTVIVHVHNL